MQLLSDKVSLSPTAKGIIGTRKQSCFVRVSHGGEHSTGSYWDSGSRSVYRVVDMRTTKGFTPPAGSYPTFDGRYQLKSGEVLISTGTFCGKEATPSITFLADDIEMVERYFALELSSQVA